MTLQDLIDQLSALRPLSAREAQVVAVGEVYEFPVDGSVYYSDGVVKIKADVTDSYDEGFKDGLAKGRAENDD